MVLAQEVLSHDCGKRCSVSGTHHHMRKLQTGRACVCVVHVYKKGGREVFHENGNRLAGKNHSLSVCYEQAMGKREHV